MSGWEQLLLGIIAIALLVYFLPVVKTMLERSKEAKSDWPGLLWPIALMILLVIFVISILK